MNKLVIGNEDDISDITVTEDLSLSIYLNGTNRDIAIHVLDDCCLSVFALEQDTANKISYHLGKNAKVIVNKFAKEDSDVVDAFLDGENAEFNFYQSVINYNDHICVENVVHRAIDTKSNIINHGVNVENHTLHFLVNGTIEQGAKESEFHQDNKIINLKDGKSFIFPNLLVDEQNVNASHAAYIGTFQKEELFYLESRGIPKDKCERLLLQGFLLQNMNLEEDDREKVDDLIEQI